ncbi:MAG: hypothetical protein P4K86_09145 [Terracidiphilus sp.]|nr:hypothetical protein [Terracidiphilus sp.]MDR3777037.1 hypothetical protein [Terracidiphilus sp.]
MRFQLATILSCGRWRLRDLIAAAGLFLATAGVILWQNAHLVILWDLSYVLDSATRIALGQVPYRDFPFAHAPLTFLIQAAIIRLTGRVFFHHVLYAAVVGGMSTVLAWRIALQTLHGRLAAAWTVSLLLAAPLTVLGIYCILPHPSYDCDCAFSILCALLLLQRLTPDAGDLSASRPSNFVHAFLAGAAVVLPLFFKQNIGLPLLLVTLAAIGLLLVVGLFRRTTEAAPGTPALLAVLAGALTTLAAAGLLIHLTAGLGNYIHWTIQFAAQRRLPGLKDMLGVYAQPSLLWMLPCVAAALALLKIRFGKARWGNRWPRVLALVLLAAPFLWTLFTLFLYDDADERGDSLLALWPLLLILAGALTLFNLSRNLSLRTLLPAVVLVAINGTLLSQQLWGSTYAIWPLLILLIAEMIAFLATAKPRSAVPGDLQDVHFVAPALAAVVAATLLICGGFYTVSEERLSYVQLPEERVQHATLPELKGMAAPGNFVPGFEELLRFAAADIPASDGLILLPGEDPFYFATGRVPQFPVLLFDPATDPYSPAQLLEQARSGNIRWLIVKRELQIKEDPTPQREATMQALMQDFKPYRQLQSYDVYRRPQRISE